MVKGTLAFDFLFKMFSFGFIFAVMLVFLCIPCILIIDHMQISSAYFSLYEQIHSSYSANTNSEILLEDLTHSVYSLYTYRFIPHYSQ
jgi:hypothetical protein